MNTGRLTASLATFLALTLAAPAAEQKSYRIDERPEWADPLPAEDRTDLRAERIPDGIFYLLSDRFSRVETGEHYGRYARKILNEEGVQNGSEISIEFDPSWEAITLHAVDVLRDGQWTSRLSPEIVDVLRREEDMENFIVDGDLTLVIRLLDIRPGDVICYDFTRTGKNPVMGGHFYRSFSTGGTEPQGKIRHRILAAPSAPLFTRGHLTHLEPSVDGRLMTWQIDEPPVFAMEDDVPRSISLTPWVEVSDFSEWSQVVAWALPLYDRGEPLPEDLRARAEGFTGSPAEKAASALRLVQDEVRYLGREDGIYSHQPRPPAVIYEQRAGDCKEKVLLLMSLLRELGIESHPVLVNTEWREGIGDWLPSPHAFNHVILEAKIDGRSHFVDPTRSFQRGPLEQIYIPPYGLGLRIAAGEKSLIPVMPPDESQGKTWVEEKIEVPSPTGKGMAQLDVRSVFTGVAAERTRASFAADGLDKTGEAYMDFYARKHPQIQSASPLRFEDDPGRNTLTVHEQYQIPDFWKNGDDGILRAQFGAQELLSRLERPDRATRKWPFAISFPSRLEVVTRVRLPEDWPSPNVNTRSKNPWFTYAYHAVGSGKTITATGHYESRVPSVPATDIPAYQHVVDKVAEGTGFELTYKPANSSGKLWQLNFAFVGVVALSAALSLTAGCGLLFAGRAAAPREAPSGTEHLDGLRGWLIVVGIGVVLAPLSMFVSVVATFVPYLTADLWATVTAMGGAPRGLLWLAALFLESALNTAFLILRLTLIPLFFLKSRRFPMAFMATVTGQTLFLLADSAIIPAFGNDPAIQADSWRLAFSSLFTTSIWVPYMLLSRRVRATFRH